MNEALLLIDIQNDFMPTGRLPVPKGDEVVPVANWWMNKFNDRLIIATQDWHPADHMSFAVNHKDKKPFDMVELDGLPQCLWNVHCVQDTLGADFHPDLLPIPFVFCKGEDLMVDSYSGFFDNGRKNKTQLDSFLKEREVKKLFVMGLATDFCVKFTVLDALMLGYNVDVIVEGCRAVNVNPNDGSQALNDMATAGAKIII